MSGVDLHWFLPDQRGDSRQRRRRRPRRGAGPAGRRGERARLPRPDRPQAAEQVGFEAVLTPTGTWCEDAWLTTATLRRAHRAAEVPGRLPARAWSRRRWPRRWRRPSSGCRGGRLLLNVVTGGERDRAAALRRLPRQGRALRAHAASSCTSCAALWRASRRLRRRALPGRGRARDRLPDPVPRIYFGGSSPAAGAGRRPARRRLPDLGRAARAGGARRSRGCASWRPSAGPRRCASASACT